jgi:hypothetical protein
LAFLPRSLDFIAEVGAGFENIDKSLIHERAQL